MVYEVVKEKWKDVNVELVQIICDKCNEELARVYYSSVSYQVSVIKDCEHYKWIKFGNECWNRLPCRECPLGFNVKQCKEIARKVVKVLRDGTNVYVLVPRE